MEKIIFEDLPSTNTPINANNLNTVQDNVERALENTGGAGNLKIALGLDQDTYDSTATYSVGDLVIHDNIIYECNTDIDTAEEWDETKWDVVPIIDKTTNPAFLISPVADYVTEQGTKNGWKYRKWKSGKIELINTFQYTNLPMTTASAGTYYGQGGTAQKTEDLPFNLSEVDYIGHQLGGRSSGVWCYGMWVTNGNQLNSEYRALASNSAGMCTTTFYIVGKLAE